MWLLGIELRTSLEEQSVLLTSEPSLQHPHTHTPRNTFICKSPVNSKLFTFLHFPIPLGQFSYTEYSHVSFATEGPCTLWPKEPGVDGGLRLLVGGVVRTLSLGRCEQCLSLPPELPTQSKVLFHHTDHAELTSLLGLLTEHW